MTPNILREIVEYTLSHRTSDERFDVITEGVTPAGRDGAEVVEPFAAAGLTWWIEVPPSLEGPAEILRRRVEEGPPRG